ncbi:MAG TPA: hypothetical protein VID48_11560 [Solirubrobacteraceae bacterium]|jgi:hypothetical protein
MSSEAQGESNSPLSVGGIIRAAGSLYRRHPFLFLVFALAVMAPYELIVLAATGYGPLSHRHQGTGTEWLLFLLRDTLVTPLISALHMHAVMRIREGERPRLADVAARGIRALPVVAAAEIMATLGIGVGLVAFIIPGVILAVRWAVVAQVAALEADGWVDALHISRRLTTGHFRHIFGLLFTIWVIGAAVALGTRSIDLGNTSGAASVSAGIALETAIASFVALTLALLYLDLKARLALEQRRPEREYPHLRDLD